ncbi:MAG: hypothetical protein ACJAUA_000316 [Zhongshania aliphaticivorans]|jgi:hypothetical protein
MYFGELVKKILGWSYDADYLHQLREDSALDEHYTNLLDAEQLLKKLSAFYSSEDSEKAQQKLAKLQEEVIDFYLSSFQNFAHVGSEEAYLQPDLLIGLGCKQPNLELRGEGLAKLAKEHPAVDLLLSGAGYALDNAESRWLGAFLMESGVPAERMLYEEDAMDTIGNAVLSKLYLKKLGRLSEIKHIVVLTSGFHANRTLNVFQKVFDNDTKIAVAGVGSDSSSELVRRRVIGELKSDAVSSEQIFRSRDIFETSSLQSEDIPEGDEIALFYQLLMHHDLYKRRFDLLRKYKSVLL